MHFACYPVVCALQSIFLVIPRPGPGFELDALMGLDRRRQGECAVVDWAASDHALHRVRTGRCHGTLALQDVSGAFDGYVRKARGRPTE
eukprot:7330625-Pyramimonas_sp.AAC.1